MKQLFTTLLTMLGLCSACQSQEIPTLEPTTYEEALQQTAGAVLIDVRQPDEYAEGHLSGARLLNVLDEATFEAGIAALDKSKPYFIYCRSGRRSHSAAVKMKAIGLNVTDLKGGITAWEAAGKPITKE